MALSCCVVSLLYYSKRKIRIFIPWYLNEVNIQGKNLSHTWIARLTVSGFFVLIGAVLNTYWSRMDKGMPCNFWATNYRKKTTKISKTAMFPKGKEKTYTEYDSASLLVVLRKLLLKTKSSKRDQTIKKFAWKSKLTLTLKFTDA